MQAELNKLELHLAKSAYSDQTEFRNALIKPGNGLFIARIMETYSDVRGNKAMFTEFGVSPV